MLPRIIAAVAPLTFLPAAGSAAEAPAPKAAALVREYCLDCHGAAVKKGGLDLEALDVARPGAAAETWEKVVRKLHHRQMPPLGEPRPAESDYAAAAGELAGSLEIGRAHV